MLVASVGLGTASDMGLASARADDDPSEPIDFAGLEPLVRLMQETTAPQLVPVLVERLSAGTDLKQLVAAAALANARTFGGEDYVGFHTLMALAPAYHMSRELPDGSRALPVLKVLYRNTNRIQEHGGRRSEVLHAVRPATLSAGHDPGEALRDAVRRKNMNEAECTFAAIAAISPDDAFNSLLVAVEDETEVHRVVLPYRAWELLDVVGREQAHTMLRQSVRYCVKSERDWPRSVGDPAMNGSLPCAGRSSSRVRRRPPTQSQRRSPMGSPRARLASRSRWRRTSLCFATRVARSAGRHRASRRGASMATRSASMRAMP
jgi:hypothetical protein